MKIPISIEPLLQQLRIRQAVRHIPKDRVLVDLGCDIPPVLINKVKAKMKHCYGLDIVIENKMDGNVTYVKQDFQKKIDIPKDTADVVTMLAVLEHVKYPQDILKECFRIMCKDGVILITVPSPKGKGILEWMGKVGLVRDEMIDQHENYFTHEKLFTLLSKSGFRNIEINAFEFGYNTFAKAMK